MLNITSETKEIKELTLYCGAPKSLKMDTEMIQVQGLGDSGSSACIMPPSLFKRLKEPLQLNLQPCTDREPESLKFGPENYKLQGTTTLPIRLNKHGAPPLVIKDVKFLIPVKTWPTDKVLIGESLFMHFGIENPLLRLYKENCDLQAISARGMSSWTSLEQPQSNEILNVQKESRPTQLDTATILNDLKADDRSAHARFKESTEAGPLSAPLATHGFPFPDASDAVPDELDKLGTVPDLATTADSYEADIEHKQALAELIGRGKEAIENLKGLSSRQRSRLSERWTGLITRHQGAFRVKFYPKDGPAKVKPWVEPLKADAKPRKQQVRPRRYAPAQSQFLDTTTDTMVNCGLLVRAGGVDNAHQAFAMAPAVVPPKKVEKDAPITKRFRLAWDLRASNELSQFYPWPTPTIEQLEQRFAGSCYFWSADGFNSFWLLPLAEESKQVFTLVTDKAVYTSNRVLQGAMNASSALNQATDQIFGKILAWLVKYADDFAAGGKTAEEALDRMEEFLSLCLEYGFFLNPAKFQPLSERLSFVGRVITKDGISVDPAYVEGIAGMAPPPTCAALATFLGMLTWLADSLPNIQRIMAPLQELKKSLLTSSKKKNKKAMESIPLGQAWKVEHQQAFENCKRCVVNAIQRAIINLDDELLLFTDASYGHWSGFLATCPAATFSASNITFTELKPVAFLGGTFTEAERKYGMPQKEVLANLRTLERCAHLLIRDKPFYTFVDAQAMTKVVELGDPASNNSHVIQGRIQRWATYLSRFNTICIHLPGENNFAADYASRFRLPSASPAGAESESTPSSVQGTAIGSTNAIKAQELENESSERTAKRSDDTYDFQKARVSQLDHVSFTYPTIDEIRQAQQDAINGAIITREALDSLPKDMQEWIADEIATNDAVTIINEQATIVKDGLILVQPSDKSESEKQTMRIWIPLHRPDIISRLCVAAHAGIAGHRGYNPTADELRAHFYWKGQRKIVRAFVNRCLHCRSAYGSRHIQRPLLPTMKVERPNQCISFDFVKMADKKRTAAKAKRGAKIDDSQLFPYMLTIVDRFSRKTMLQACEAADAENAVGGLLEWFQHNTIPDGIYSDRGTHFKNTVVEALEENYGIEHIYSVPYSPWTNGQVERIGGIAQELIRKVTSERKMAPEFWYQTIGVVQHAMNTTKQRALGDLTPLEVWGGPQPKKPIDIIAEPGVAEKGQELQLRKLEEGQLQTLYKAASDALQKLRLDEATAATARSIELTTRNNEKKRALRLVEGDYVMVTEKTPPIAKASPRWTGPHQIIECLSEHRYQVKNLLTGTTTTEHASHLEYYDDATVHITAHIRNQVAHETYGFEVRRIEAHRENEDGTWSVLPIWRGFEDVEMERVWRDLHEAYLLLPQMIQRYLRKVLTGPKANRRLDGEKMCKALELDPDFLSSAPLTDLDGS